MTADVSGEELGRRIVQARDLKGWSQARLAKEARVSEATVSKIERGTGRAQPGKLRAVLDALDIEPAATALRRDYPRDVELVRDMIGLWLTEVPEEDRAAEILRLTRFIYTARTEATE